MESEFKKNIIEDLEKSGFGSEMRALRFFLTKGWGCLGSPSFMDLDEQKPREYDIFAFHLLTHEFDNGQKAESWFHVIAEVKKTEKPWVVFKGLFQDDYDLHNAWNELFTHKNLPCDPEQLLGAISSCSVFEDNKWEAYGVHESFKKPDAKSRWYSACITACKAAESLLQSARGRLHDIPQNPSNDIEFDFYKPVIILDGPLLATELVGEGIIDVNEIT